MESLLLPAGDAEVKASSKTPVSFCQLIGHPPERQRLMLAVSEHAL